MGRVVLAVAAVALVGGLAGATVPAGPVAAHAALVSSSPTDGDRVDRSPDAVEMTFSENVSAGLGSIRVLDAEGERVDRGGVEVRGGRVTAALEGDLPDGTYVVAWRVISADSHPIKGAFAFGVGDGAASVDGSLVDSLLGDDGDGPWRVLGAGARGLAYGGTLLAVGLAVFLAVAHDGGPERARLRRVVRITAGVGAAGLLAELPTRAALATGLGPDSITAPGVLSQLLADHVGVALAVGLLALLFVAVDGGRDRVVAGACTLAVGVAFGVAGHTATSSPLVLAIGADALHVTAAAVWLGGVAGCAAVAWARRRTDRSPAAVVVRFSGVAGLALAGVTVAGGALGWSQVRTVDALVTTSYGQLLIAKVAVVGLVACLGGWNRYRLVPVLEHDLATSGVIDPEADPAPVEAPGEAGGASVTAVAVAAPPRTGVGPAVAGHLRRTLAAEALLLLAVVGVTAVLVDVTPARSAVAAPYEGSAALGDGRVDIDVDPTRAGRTTMHLYLYDEAGQPWDIAEGVEVRFSLPSADIGAIEREPLVSGPGHYTRVGDDFSIAGTWRVEVVARTSLYEEETARFAVPIVP